MRFVRRYILHNLHLKVASVLLALLLWSVFSNEPPVEVVFQSPLEFRNMPQALELGNEVPTSVQVRVRGPAPAVRQLSGNDMAVALNLSGFDNPGERSYPLTVKNIQIPFGVQVTQIIPAQVRVRFEARSRRSIPVAPRIVGRPAPGYQLAAYQVIPPTLSVVGPESHVRALESAVTDPVDITGVIARAQFLTHVYVTDPLVRIEDSEPVQVMIQVKKQQ